MDDLLSRGVEEIIDRAALERVIKGKGKLRIKFGVDPSSPDIHLGHAVELRKLRQLQDMGHVVIFLIGDATGRVGDPSGRNKTRPVLTDAEITANAQTYLDQAKLIIDIDKTELRRNSEWWDKLKFAELLKLAAKFTVAQLIERDDFKQRLESGNDLGLHELLYPVMQAYDSVMLEADVEFGGTDQRFNLLAGRALQKKMDQSPQHVFMCKLLVGTDGVNKMSKSLGNYIGVTDKPEDMYGKVMRIPDELIGPYYELCTDVPLDVVEAAVKSMADGANPRDVKASLAREIVQMYHGPNPSEKAEDEFNQVFRDREAPSDLKTLELKSGKDIISAVAASGVADSNSAARRLVDQGGVRLDDQVADLTTEPKNDSVLQIGKRYFARLKIKP